MRRRDEEHVEQEVKYRIIQLNRASGPSNQIKGIMGLIKLEIGSKETRNTLYYAIERNLSSETKRIITTLIEQAAKNLKLTPTPLFT